VASHCTADRPYPNTKECMAKPAEAAVAAAAMAGAGLPPTPVVPSSAGAGAVPLTGGCLCGKHRYAITTAPKYVYYCHCSMCRKASGSVVGAWLTVDVASFKLSHATDKSNDDGDGDHDDSDGGEPLAVYASSSRFERHFCSACGSHIMFCRRESPVFVEVCHGSLDAPQDWPPQNHIWTSAQLPFLTIDTHLPTWAAEPC
jgi:hypothetical protein